MSTDRRRFDPFAPRHKVQPEAPTVPPVPEVPAQPDELTPDFAAILDALPNDIDHITLKELRELAAQAGVPDYGTKAEIVARIRAAADK